MMENSSRYLKRFTFKEINEFGFGVLENDERKFDVSMLNDER
jgi:hypothetical protein